MSILTQLLRKQITWDQAKAAAEGWAAKVAKQVSPDAAALVGEALADVKQGASNAIMLADSLAGPLIAKSADIVGAEFDILAKAYLGPVGAVLSPAVHDGIGHLAAALKAEIDARALAARAALGTPAATPASPPASLSSQPS